MTEVVGTFRKAIDALERGEAAIAHRLAGVAEGGRETHGAYKKGWR